jgi:aerobic-type carbon monoxide dehydrogenase small subunit (CoxS/CutS family)
MNTGCEISLTINGTPREVTFASADRTLLSVLRDDFDLTGAKEGCGIGVCGACTVIVDGEMVSSCIQLAVLTDGSTVRTVEGLADGSKLDAVQRAFIDNNGLQCGACTPGQIMAARSLLDHQPNPTEADVVEWMTGNLCRCTGYAQILRSVLAAAQDETA